ncbi:hypothetical protein DB30_00969 [Enhygromyxa salina]|uniref:Uncharacterized protein n=1 Tax=Enhygromyxa salina TaxID=215803 RepID=A0A0C2CNP9_9BACT|nr:hypothetical protein [Enhygromyxa salina]KIG12851.1 hypothetical protein DB30_00969 [Enhygromyxa salina]
MPEPKRDGLFRGLVGRLSPLARQRAAWLLAPVLATAAIGFQVALDVPRAPMLERSEKPPKKPRKSAAARNAQSQAEQAKAKQAKAKQAKAKRAKAKKPHERSARALAGLRKRWADVPLEDEPINQNFRRRHEGLLRSVVTRARAQAFKDGPPPLIQIRPGCHTIRCDLELCGPAKAIATVAELLPEVTLDGQQLWHSFNEVTSDREPPKGSVCRRWIVDFTHDGGDATKLAF